MIETAINTGMINGSAEQSGSHKILKMKRNSRMAGSMPVWESHKTNREAVLQNIASAQQGQDPASASALSYAKADISVTPGPSEEFTFADMVDMINPLQHIPLVGHIYRGATGDEIKPISQIVGGAVFGGAVGAGTSLVNVAIKHETGKDLTESAIHMVFPREESAPETINWNNPTAADIEPAAGDSEEIPQDIIDELIKIEPGATEEMSTSPEELSGTLISVTDLGQGREKIKEKRPHNSGRMAGSIVHSYTRMKSIPVYEREQINAVTIDAMPPRWDKLAAYNS